MTISEMATRFDAHTQDVLAFTMDEWLDMNCADRDARRAEIDMRHSYKHGWITVGDASFDMRMAYPERSFANVWE